MKVLEVVLFPERPFIGIGVIDENLHRDAEPVVGFKFRRCGQDISAGASVSDAGDIRMQPHEIMDNGIRLLAQVKPDMFPGLCSEKTAHTEQTNAEGNPYYFHFISSMKAYP